MQLKWVAFATTALALASCSTPAARSIASPEIDLAIRVIEANDILITSPNGKVVHAKSWSEAIQIMGQFLTTPTK